MSNPHEDMIWPRMQLMSKAPHHQGNSLTKSLHSRVYLFGIKRCRQTKKINHTSKSLYTTHYLSSQLRHLCQQSTQQEKDII